jgi:hypothetical protein
LEDHDLIDVWGMIHLNHISRLGDSEVLNFSRVRPHKNLSTCLSQGFPHLYVDTMKPVCTWRFTSEQSYPAGRYPSSEETGSPVFRSGRLGVPGSMLLSTDVTTREESYPSSVVLTRFRQARLMTIHHREMERLEGRKAQKGEEKQGRTTF